MIIQVLSVPRSGTTLLYRILKASDKSVSEPDELWIAPLLAEVYHDQLMSPLGGSLISKGILNALPDEKLYLLGEFLYSSLRQKQECEIIIDKTPRNIHAYEYLRRIENSKFIILIRHPISIAISYFDTFYNGKLYWALASIDLIDGLSKLNNVLMREELKTLKYENIINSPNEAIDDLEQYLKLCIDISNLNLQTGKIGDPSLSKHNGISKFSDADFNTKWRKQSLFKQLLFKRWAENTKIAGEIIKVGHYAIPPLHITLASVTKSIPDIYNYTKSWIAVKFQLKVLLSDKRFIR